jgi:hypoxanthine phosphoribosyltransferase|tara:strand:- start:509 stop:907 length:399 start_codon:yes stop_codon:yes gene_type:complete
MHVNPGKEILDFTWEEYDEAVEQMAIAAKGAMESTHIDAIYGIPRGGLVLGVSLSHALDLPLISSLGLYDGKRKNLLVVDDISDTGETLVAMSQTVDESLFYTLHYDENSAFEPDFYYASNSDCWIKYPWEK